MASVQKTAVRLFLEICLLVLYDGFTWGRKITGKPNRNGNTANVLLIVVDDLRPNLGCYGDSLAITAELDKIASSGIVFEKAYAQQALCGPSRTSFLTSRRPDTIRLVDVHYYWRSHSGNYTTLPQYLKERGYHTVSAGKVFHPGIVSNYSDDQPFSWSEVPFHPSTQKYKNAAVCHGFDGSLHANIYCPVQVSQQPEKTLPDIQTTKFVLQWLKNYKRRQRPNEATLHNSYSDIEAISKPFFLAVGFHKPHIPLKFPAEFLDLYPIDAVPLAPNRHLPKGLPVVSWNPWNDLRWRYDIAALNVSFPFGPLPDKYSRYVKQGYYASTSYTDSLIGLITSEVTRFFPNTIVAVIGDHGWSLGEHQEWSKYSNFEIATRVPFIISLPQTVQSSVFQKENSMRSNSLNTDYFLKYFKTYVKKNKKSKKEKPKLEYRSYNGLVELLDLFPTVVDLVGLPTMPSCSTKVRETMLCTEGISLSCIIYDILQKDTHSYGSRTGHINTSCPRKLAVLSQYPRPSVSPSVHPDSDQCRLTETKIMGYSLRTDRFRYTTWRPFNNSDFNSDWSRSYGDELYDHKYDDDENNNIVDRNSKLVKILKKYLKFVVSGP